MAEYRLTITVKDNPENIRNARRVIMDTDGAASGAGGRAGGRRGPSHGQKTECISNSSHTLQKNLRGTRRGLQPPHEQRMRPVGLRARPTFHVDPT